MPPPAPVITAFTAAQSPITAGHGTTLTATFSEGTGNVDHGVGVVASGAPVVVSPAADTLYTLTVTGPGGTVTHTALVAVVPPPAVVRFAAGRDRVTAGTGTTLVAEFEHGAATLAPDLGPVASGVPVPTGNLAEGATTFTLTVTNPAGTQVQAQLTVTASAAAAASLAVAPSLNPPFNAPIALTPMVSGAASIRIGTFQGGADLSDNAVSGVPVAAGRATGTRTFWVRAVNPAGDATDASVTVTPQRVVVQAIAPATPVVRTGAPLAFTATVQGGETGAVTWSASAGAFAGNLWTAPGAAGPVTVTATSVDDPSQSLATVVTVADAPAAPQVSAPSLVTAGLGATASVVPQAGCSYAWAIGNGALVSGQGTPTLAFTAGASGEVSLQCVVTDGHGFSSPAGVAVCAICPPPAQPVIAAPALATAGQGGYTASITPQAGCSYAWTVQGGTLTSGATGSTVTFTAGPSGTATLSCVATNAAGTASAPATAEVGLVAPPSSSGLTGPARVTAAKAGYTVSVPSQTGCSYAWSLTGGIITAGATASTMTFTPGAPGTLTASCVVTNAAGTASAPGTFTLTCLAAPAITGLTASDPQPLYGATVTLVAEFTGGTASLGTAGPGSSDLGAAFASGAPVGPTAALVAPVTFTLTVTNANGDSATRTCLVIPQTVTVQITAGGGGVLSTGRTRTLTASVTGALDGTVTWTGPGRFAPDALPSGAATVWTAPAVQGAYVLTAASAADPTRHAATSVRVVPPATVQSFAATPVNPAWGASVSLRPVFSDAVSARLGTTPGGSEVAAGVVSGGTYASGPVRAWTEFWLTLENEAGDLSYASSQVDPTPVTVGAIAPAAPTLTAGTSRTFTCTVTGAADPALAWSATGGAMASATGVWQVPAAPGAYTITATSVADPTKVSSTLATVVAAPAITTFSAARTLLTAGGGTTLSWSYSGGEGLLNQGLGAAAATGSIAVTPAATTTYTLSVTNAAGTTVSRSVTVTVVAPPHITSFQPLSAGVQAGGQATLTATYENGWGSVDQGLGYLASGSSMPTRPLTQGTTFTLTVTNSAGATVTATTTVRVVRGGFAGVTWTVTGRFQPTSTRLPNGKVLVAGGQGAAGVLPSAELFDPDTGVCSFTGFMTTPRLAHGAALLPDGTVLVVGGNGPTGPLASAERYDPATGTFSATGSLATARANPAVVLLPNGKVLVAGGGDALTGPLASAELYDPATGAFSPAGSMASARYLGSATLMRNGKVLIAGGTGAGAPLAQAECYDPATGGFVPTGALAEARSEHTATLLPDGQVLIAGGAGAAEGTQALASAERYDPATGLFSPTGPLAAPRAGHTALLLPDGDVLVAGGRDGAALAGAERYAWTAGTFQLTGGLAEPRYGHTATLLGNGKVLHLGGTRTGAEALNTAECYDAQDPAPGVFASSGPMGSPRALVLAAPLPDGKVLLASGNTGSSYLATADVYDPVTGSCAPTRGPLNAVRARGGAVLLPDGRVLLAGGASPSSGGATAELYDPATGLFTPTGAMAVGRVDCTATLLPNGKVLVAGGPMAGTLAELYDPATGLFTPTGPMTTARMCHTATLLGDGTVLLAGGYDGGFAPTASAELYDPRTGTFMGVRPMAAAREEHKAVLLAQGQVLVMGGSGAMGGTGDAEIYDPATRQFRAAAPMGTSRVYHQAVLLPDGRVLVLGGYNGTTLATSEVFNPWTGAWTPSGLLQSPRAYLAAILLPNGKVLAAGGMILGTGGLATTETFQ